MKYLITFKYHKCSQNSWWVAQASWLTWLLQQNPILQRGIQTRLRSYLLDRQMLNKFLTTFTQKMAVWILQTTGNSAITDSLSCLSQESMMWRWTSATTLQCTALEKSLKTPFWRTSFANKEVRILTMELSVSFGEEPKTFRLLLKVAKCSGLPPKLPHWEECSSMEA